MRTLRNIRAKMYFGMGLLLMIVGLLSWTAIHGHYAYRTVVRSIYHRVPELPLANNFNSAVGDLRVFWHATQSIPTTAILNGEAIDDRSWRQAVFAEKLTAARDAFQTYRQRLVGEAPLDPEMPISDSRQERETTYAVEMTLAEIARLDSLPETPDRDLRLTAELDRLETAAARLPTFLHENIENAMAEARDQYRTIIIVGWLTSIGTLSFTTMLVFLFYRWVFRPLRMLIKGSRRIAGGQFAHRIHLDTRDEMCELAENMNDMTQRFQEIRDDLDRQVAERTQQVVRGEQMASVGFLAAGVAHEINNPLAAIAGCAEALQRRLSTLVPDDHEDRKLVTQYLAMISKEAFRCKGITDKLLDFSRVGDVKRRPEDLRTLVQDVVDMVRTLEKYEGKHVEIVDGSPLFAVVNGPEIKQVVLNLMTNALDSVDGGGKLTIEFATQRDEAVLTFTDDGCGMTEEVRTHLFEPFFTRRRNGQGTGLGLSISYRIISDHHGTMTAHSDGTGKGSQFCVRLPAVVAEKETGHHSQAA